MTKLSDLGPPVIGKRHGVKPTDEGDRFYNCPHCGQLSTNEMRAKCSITKSQGTSR